MNTHFIGREKGLATLEASFLSCSNTPACAVLQISGEAGAGKSRLVEQFIAGSSKPTAIMRAACFSKSNTAEAYYPIKELLSSIVNPNTQKMGVGERLSRQASLKVTEELLGKAGELASSFIPGWKLAQSITTFALEETGVLESLKTKILGAAEAPIQNLDNNKIAYQFSTFLKGVSETIPIQIIIDDSQWMDEASAGLLRRFTRDVKGYPIMIILCYRSSELASIESSSEHNISQYISDVEVQGISVKIDLQNLPDKEQYSFTKTFLDTQVGSLPESFIQSFHKLSDGSPLFCQELLISLIENKTLLKNEQDVWQVKSGAPINITTAMTGVIRERIDRLEPRYRKWLDIAAVQQHSFVLSAISSIEEIKEGDLLFEFSKVLDKKLGLVEECNPDYINGEVVLRYQFSNKLIQEYLYNSLSEGEKHYLHKNTADHLKLRFQDYIEFSSSLIARHYLLAMNYSLAYNYDMKACEYEYCVGAYSSCVNNLNKILKYLPLIPNQEQPVKMEISVLSMLSGCYIALYGYGSDKLSNINKRAEMLHRELQNDEALFSIIWTDWSGVMINGYLSQAEWLAGRLMALAEATPSDNIKLVEAYHSAGVTKFNSGKFTEAKLLLEKGLAQLNHSNREEHIRIYGNDTEVLLLSWLTWNCLLLGDMRKSEAYKIQLENGLKDQVHTSSAAFGYIFLAMWYVFQDKPKECWEIIQTHGLEKVKDLPFWKIWANILQKWADFRINATYQCPDNDIKDFIKHGGGIWAPFFNALAADMLNEEQATKAANIFDREICQLHNSDALFHALPILFWAKKFFAKVAPSKVADINTLAKGIAKEQQGKYWIDKF